MLLVCSRLLSGATAVQRTIRGRWVKARRAISRPVRRVVAGGGVQSRQDVAPEFGTCGAPRNSRSNTTR